MLTADDDRGKENFMFDYENEKNNPAKTLFGSLNANTVKKIGGIILVIVFGNALS